MSHPDDGTIQSLLDGELDAEARTRVEIHVSSCAACGARLAEARAFQQEADRLVELVVVPPAPPLRRGTLGRRPVVRALAWAASIVVAVAAGYWGRGTTPRSPAQRQELDRPTETSVLPRPAPPAAAATPTDEPSAPAFKEPAAGGAAARRVAEPGVTTTPEIGKVAAEEPRDAAPRPEAKAADRVTAPPTFAAEREALDGRGNQLAKNGSRLADAAVVTWRVVSMEEAVRVLGGQIRLIDGLSPDRIELGPGTAVAGADPGLQVVRVVYAAGTVTLDEQRPAQSPSARQEAASASGAVAQRAAPGWQERGEIRFVVTGSVSADSLRTLGARVR